MDPQIINLIEGPLIISFLVGITYVVKLMFWGKGPVRRVKGSAEPEALEQRIAELEERWEHHLSQVESLHSGRLEELEERVDFTERLLAQRRQEEPPPALHPGVSTPE